MPWTNLAAYFFGGACLANSVPHLVAGVSGRSFHSPFANPPFRGFSPPGVNVGWALFNLAVAYLLLLHVGRFDPRSFLHAGFGFAGFGLMGLQCARAVVRMRSERATGPTRASGTYLG
ncbi:MAG TPA: hypothetical protein VEQ59_12645 [Polyangiaceae bacterium]|nr:hypothetical protein [Polyangiaceae bacterium]